MTRIPLFGATGGAPYALDASKHLVDDKATHLVLQPAVSNVSSRTFSLKVDLAQRCLYSDVPQRMAQFGFQEESQVLASLRRELPTLIGEEVDRRMAVRLDNQKKDITSEISGAKEAMLAKKSNSIVTLNGSILGVGKVTEAYSKTIELLQGLGKAWRGAARASSNVDNVSFPRQVGRAALNGAKGSLKITAGGLGAAVVMSALLATSGIALNKVHDAFPSVPSATSIVAGVSSRVEALKVSVGSVEIEKAGGPAARTLGLQERATALLAQNNQDYGKTIESVNTALGLSYMNGNAGAAETIDMQKALLARLQQMQTAQSATNAVATAPTAIPSMP